MHVLLLSCVEIGNFKHHWYYQMNDPFRSTTEKCQLVAAIVWLTNNIKINFLKSRCHNVWPLIMFQNCLLPALCVTFGHLFVHHIHWQLKPLSTYQFFCSGAFQPIRLYCSGIVCRNKHNWPTGSNQSHYFQRRKGFYFFCFNLEGEAQLCSRPIAKSQWLWTYHEGLVLIRRVLIYLRQIYRD